MFEFCVEEMNGIDFLFLNKSNIRVNMEERYKRADTVPETRSFHEFISVSDSIIGAKYASDDQYYAIQFAVHFLGPGDTLSPSQFTVCLYDRQYWVGIIMEVSTENLDVNVKFMHPKPSTLSLKCPSCDDLCWVLNVHVCHIVCLPELSSQAARMYCFNTSECEKNVKNNSFA